MLAAEHVNLDELGLVQNPFLGQRDAHAGGVGEPFIFVNLHD